MYKKIFLSILVIFIAAGGLSIYKSFVAPEPVALEERSPDAVASTTTQSAAQLPPDIQPQTQAALAAAPETSVSTSTKESSAADSGAHHASITVDGKTYETEITERETLFDAMKLLATSHDFTFTYRTYQGIGAFIDSINGRKNANGYYWILYVNGTSSQFGASQVALSPGDSVEWKYEQGY